MQKRENITIDDIAKDLGVSKTTVSRAISGKGRISSATREKVQKYIKDHNYRPNAAAKALAENKTYNLAFVIPRSFISLDLPYVRQSMGAAAEEAAKQNYTLLLCLTTDDDPSLLNSILEYRKVDGVILSRTVEKDILVDILSAHKMPFSTIGTLPPSLRGAAAVEADHDQIGGCRAFSKAFLENHPEKVAVFGNDLQYIVNQSRLAGLRLAMQDIGFPPKNVIVQTGVDSAEKCAQLVDGLLAQGVTRFLAMDDEICMLIFTHLQKIQCSDIALASLCDSDKVAAAGISALSFNAAELGRTACAELLAHIQGRDYNRTPRLGYRIMLRNSF